MCISQSIEMLPDTTIVHRDTTYNSNVPFPVTKAENPQKLVILGSDIIVYNDGSLEFFGEDRWHISGKFFTNDSMSIVYSAGKLVYSVTYYNGKK